MESIPADIFLAVVGLLGFELLEIGLSQTGLFNTGLSGMLGALSLLVTASAF